jgi:hypothetical protein
MSDSKEPFVPERRPVCDWWSRHFGSRGLLQLVIGIDTESLVLLMLSGALVFVIAVQGNTGPLGSLVWLLAILIILFFLRKVVTEIMRLIEAIRGRRS